MSTSMDILTEFQSIYMAGDAVKACRQYVSTDLELIEPPELPQGGVFHGWDAPIRVTAIYTGIWDVQFLSSDFYDAIDDDIVFARYVATWTHKATGKSITEPVIELNKLSNAKISLMQVFHFDAGGLLKTMQ
jgi:hypothetical protein